MNGLPISGDQEKGDFAVEYLNNFGSLRWSSGNAYLAGS